MSVSQHWFGRTAKAGPSDSEKQRYYADNLAKAQAGTYTGREIKPGVELLPGWDPWGDTGKTTGAEIAAAIARNADSNPGDFTSIIPGDYFTITAGGTTYKYVCNGRDQYYISGDSTNGRHHYVFVPDRLCPNTVTYNSGNSNEWATSELKTWMEGTFYNSLPATMRDSILSLKVPFTSNDGARSGVVSKVFPPSEIEACGVPAVSVETAGGTPPNNPYTVLSRTDDTRKRTGATGNWYWLRASGSGNTADCVIIDKPGNYYWTAALDVGGALPCINLG